ncbi:hypothetical protein ACLQ2R_03315 [Streptosporangium sp. DT93]
MHRLALIIWQLICDHTWEETSRRNWISTYRCRRCRKTTTRSH